METYIDVNKLVAICELLDGGIGFLYPLLLFCGGVHGGAVVLGGTNPTVAQNMTAQNRLRCYCFSETVMQSYYFRRADPLM